MTGRKVWSTGSAVDPVLASAAIPGIFPPIERGSQLLMDGASANNTPISHAVELGVHRVIVLQAIRAGRLTHASSGVVAAGLSATLHALTRRFVEDVDRYSSAAELAILPAPALEGILPSDFDHTHELVAGGCAGAGDAGGRRPVAAADPRGTVHRARVERRGLQRRTEVRQLVEDPDSLEISWVYWPGAGPFADSGAPCSVPPSGANRELTCFVSASVCFDKSSSSRFWSSSR